MLLNVSEKMKKRKAMVEQLFGTMYRALNSVYILLKCGRTNVSAEFCLISPAYNMKRFVNVK
jgi:hypothetical protein